MDRQRVLVVDDEPSARGAVRVLLAQEGGEVREALAEARAPEPPVSAVIAAGSELEMVLEVVRSTAPSLAPVLLVGEPGTGKDLIAQALHQCSPRSAGPFLKLGCAKLAAAELLRVFAALEGRADNGDEERARGGTLLLDEPGELPEETQQALLALIEEREQEHAGGPCSCGVRIVSATRKNLGAEVRAGCFREDLFYRLSVAAVTLPPLRQRKSDILALAAHFIDQYARNYSKTVRGLLPDAREALLEHAWPGNVRELEAALERAVALCKSIRSAPPNLPPLRAVPPDEPPAESAHELPVSPLLARAIERRSSRAQRPARPSVR